MRRKKGYTFIEVIIVVALLSAVSILLYTILGQGFKLFASQSESASELLNLRQAMSDITNKARLTDPDSISYASGVLYVGSNSYSFANQSIKRNGAVIASGIDSFEVSIGEGILNITIVNLSGKRIWTSISLLG